MKSSWKSAPPYHWSEYHFVAVSQHCIFFSFWNRLGLSHYCFLFDEKTHFFAEKTTWQIKFWVRSVMWNVNINVNINVKRCHKWCHHINHFVFVLCGFHFSFFWSEYRSNSIYWQINFICRVSNSKIVKSKHESLIRTIKTERTWTQY